MKNLNKDVDKSYLLHHVSGQMLVNMIKSVLGLLFTNTAVLKSLSSVCDVRSFHHVPTDVTNHLHNRIY